MYAYGKQPLSKSTLIAKGCVQMTPSNQNNKLKDKFMHTIMHHTIVAKTFFNVRYSDKHQ